MADAGPCREKVWDRHVVHRADGEPDLLYIDLHLVHEVTSPQAFDGLRLAGRTVRRPDLTVATMDHNVPDRRPRPAARGSDLGEADGRARPQLRGVRHPLLRDGRSRPGHRARDRPRAGPDAAGHDDRVRRQPHVDARRVRRAGVRHRHQRGRARARHADPAADASRARWRSPSTATLPAGVTAKDIVLAIIARIGTGGGIGSVIEYRGTAIRGALDGGPHDGLQHVDRGGRPRRDGRARRHDVRLPRRPAVRADGRRLGARARRLAHARRPTPARRSTRRSCIDAADAATARHRGARTRRRASPIDDAVPDPTSFADAVGARVGRSARSRTWA